MTGFAPLAPSLGGGFPPREADIEPPTEATTMPKQSPADRILEVIENAGGQLSSKDLNIELDDLDPAVRRKHVQQLIADKKLVANGATSARVYALPGVKVSREKPAREMPAKAKPQPKVKTPRATAPSEPAHDDATPSVSASMPGIDTEHLKRVLVRALRAPGAINDDERESLAAVAAGL